jgi:hypothetical protein
MERRLGTLRTVRREARAMRSAMPTTGREAWPTLRSVGSPPVLAEDCAGCEVEKLHPDQTCEEGAGAQRFCARALRAA